MHTLTTWANRIYLGYPKRLFESEDRCEAIDTKKYIFLILLQIKVIITLRCWTFFSFVLKGRVLGSRKWPIVLGMNERETLLLAKNQVPNISKKMSIIISCLFNTFLISLSFPDPAWQLTTWDIFSSVTVIGALQQAIHVEQTAVLESICRTETRQTKGNIILNGNFLCLSCPSATFVLQLGGFVPRDQLAPKGLLWTNHIGLLANQISDHRIISEP